MKKILFRLLLVLFSLILSLGIGEWVVKKVKPQLTYTQAYKASADCATDDPYLPFVLKKNYKCHMVSVNKEFDINATINSMGYRGPEFPVEKPPGKKRILLLGDSFTFGHGADDTHTFAYLTQQYLEKSGRSDVEIINAGYADSFSPDSYYAYLTHYGMKLQPDAIVLSFFVYNDISDLEETVWERTNEKGLPDKIASCCKIYGNGKMHNKYLSPKYSIPVLRESHLFLLLYNTVNSRFHIFKESSFRLKREDLSGCVLNRGCINAYSQEEEKVRKVLLGISEIAKQHNIPFYVMLIPASYQVYPEQRFVYWYAVPLEKGNEDFFQKRMGEFFSSNSIAYLDLLPPFIKERDEKKLFYDMDGHFTNDGNDLAAKNLSDFISKEYLQNK